MKPTNTGMHPLVRIASEALLRLGIRIAATAIEFLHELELKSEYPIFQRLYTVEFVSNLGAVLQLAQWEQAGLREYLHGLPTAAEAVNDLFSRYLGGNGNDVEHDLLTKVSWFWFCNFSFSGFETLDKDVLLAGDTGDDLLEDLADFLWQHRHLATH